MMPAVFLEPLGEIALRHKHAARIVVANVERDERPTVVTILSEAVDRRGAAKAVHHLEIDGVFSENLVEHAAHGALFTPHLDAHGCWSQKSRR